MHILISLFLLGALLMIAAWVFQAVIGLAAMIIALPVMAISRLWHKIRG